MIVVFHANNEVVQIYDYSTNHELADHGNTIQDVLLSIATKNISNFIGWCHIDLKEQLNLTAWKTILKHPLILVSFETSNSFYVDSSIGYVEDSPFINVKKEIAYPTWLMSSDVGAIHASTLLKFKSLLRYKISFDFFLNTLSKKGIKMGLLCYSNLNLLKSTSLNIKVEKNSISTLNLLWFVISNYKFRWVILYILNLLLFQKKLLFLSFFRVLFKKTIKCQVSFDETILPTPDKLKNPTIDVLIPTLGREKYLKDVLLDLSKQTLLPTKVILIEQTSSKEEVSNLGFLNNSWPFEINHICINQLGVCNARNIGLSKVTSDWVFFADDDIRFNPNLLENAFKYLNLYDSNAISLSCLQKDEKETQKNVFQSLTFGSGTSIVRTYSLKNIKFDRAYEFGYGEDADFGMQLRNGGTDILYLPFVSIIHLKAPIGGFRAKIEQEWDKEPIQPKPSPTVMVFKLKHGTKEQLQGYKTALFIKFYSVQKIKNPFRYFRKMNKSWDKSTAWANYLIQKYSNEF